MESFFDISSYIEFKTEQKYREILRKVMIKISILNRRKNKFALIEIPTSMINISNYNFKFALAYVMKYLRLHNFNVKYKYPNILLISWGHLIYEKKKSFNFKHLIPKKDKYNTMSDLTKEQRNEMFKTSHKTQETYDKSLDVLDSLF